MALTGVYGLQIEFNDGNSIRIEFLAAGIEGIGDIPWILLGGIISKLFNDNNDNLV